MWFDSPLGLLLPFGLFLGLVLLRPGPGLRASLAALGLAALYLLASVGAPRVANFSLDREIEALYAGALTGAAVGAVAYHRLSPGWLWRAAGFAIAAAATALIWAGLIKVL
jgi:hypothetical protein